MADKLHTCVLLNVGFRELVQADDASAALSAYMHIDSGSQSPSLPFFSLEWLLSFLCHTEANAIIYLFAYRELVRTGWLEVVPSTWFGGQPFVFGDECILAIWRIGSNLSWVGYLVQFQSCVGVFRTMGLLPSFVLAFWRQEELLLPSFPSSYPTLTVIRY